MKKITNMDYKRAARDAMKKTMLASPDFGTEYKQLRTDNEAQALADFKRLFSAYHVPPLRGRYAKLAEDLRAAAAYGAEVAR